MRTLTYAFVLTSLCLNLSCSPSEESETKIEKHSTTTEQETHQSLDDNAPHVTSHDGIQNKDLDDADEAPATDADAHDKHLHKGLNAEKENTLEVVQQVSIVSPLNEAVVRSPVEVLMQVEGMEVQASGELKPRTGHYHLIIDGKPVPKGQIMRSDAHVDLVSGQRSTEVKLSPGEHTLTLQFADGEHRSYGPQMSHTVRVNVVDGPRLSGSVDFRTPQNNAEVKSPFRVEMINESLIVLPAGKSKPDTGHYHIIVDGAPIEAGEEIPRDDKHIHYDGGERAGYLNLEPGVHTLTLQFADAMHLSYGPAQSKTIAVKVVK